jgi:hypothetical protein
VENQPQNSRILLPGAWHFFPPFSAIHPYDPYSAGHPRRDSSQAIVAILSPKKGNSRPFDVNDKQKALENTSPYLLAIAAI